MRTLTVFFVVLATWSPMGNATWWKADDYDEPDGKCLVSKPDPKNKDGKPIMVWVDCDWKSGRLVTRATTTTIKPSTTTIPIATRPPGKCLAQSDVYKYKNGEPAWVWVECDWTSGRPKPITKKPSTTAKPSSTTPSPRASTSRPGQQSTTTRPMMNRTATPPPPRRPAGSPGPQVIPFPAAVLPGANSTTARPPSTQAVQG